MGRGDTEQRLWILEQTTLRLDWRLRRLESACLAVLQRLREAESEFVRESEEPAKPPAVLLWNAQIQSTTNAYQKAIATLTAAGIPFDLLSGSITQAAFDPYTLVLWSRPTGDSPWLPHLGTWKGRIVVSGEFNNPGNVASNNYVNSLMDALGYALDLVPASVDVPIIGDPTSNGPRPVDSHALTSGVGCLTGAGTSLVTGGTSLSRSFTTDQTWLAVERVGDVEMVLCGDSNLFGAGTVSGPCNEAQFLINCAQPLA